MPEPLTDETLAKYARLVEKAIVQWGAYTEADAIHALLAEIARLRDENDQLRREATELVESLEVAGWASFVAGMRVRR